MKKAIFVKNLLLALLFIIPPFFILSPKASAECDPKCSTQGKYLCGSSYGADDMCCTGGGCPDWVCQQFGFPTRMYADGGWRCCPSGTTTYDQYACISASRINGTCAYCTYCDPDSWSRCGSDCTQSNDCSFTADRSCTGGDCNPNNRPTCTSITGPTAVFDTSSVQLGNNAADSDGTISYLWSSTGGGAFSSTTATSPTWTPPSAANATYYINLKITDNKGAVVMCPQKNIAVTASYDLTVNTKLKSTTSCTPNSNLSGATVTIKTVDYENVAGPSTTDINGTKVFTVVRRDKNLLVCVTYPPSGCTSYNVDKTCTTTSSVSVANSDNNGCAEVAPPVLPATTGTITFTFGTNTTEGWVTAIDGNVEANRIGSKLTCSNYTTELNSMGFKPYLINFSNDAGTSKAYVFSNNAASNLPSTDGLIEQSTRGGWASKINGLYTYLDNLTYTVPAGNWFTTVTNLDSNVPVSTFGLYQMNVTDFNKLTENSSYNYFLRCQ
jgi:hypothetical protein